jgi:hypothetical protein
MHRYQDGRIPTITISQGLFRAINIYRLPPFTTAFRHPPDSEDSGGRGNCENPVYPEFIVYHLGLIPLEQWEREKRREEGGW